MISKKFENKITRKQLFVSQSLLVLQWTFICKIDPSDRHICLITDSHWIAQVVVNLTTIRSRPEQTRNLI
jgi:hypothetical protein